jgi:SsrA-binding protein
MSGKLLTDNRRAHRDYEIIETFEAGIVLTGTEVKSLRAGGINLKDSYARIEHEEAFLISCHIAPYSAGNRANHDPERIRKLLLKKREIRRLIGKITERGFTLVPLKAYFTNRGIVKLLLGLGKGKSKQDKREQIREKDVKREIDREMRRYR